MSSSISHSRARVRRHPPRAAKPSLSRSRRTSLSRPPLPSRRSDGRIQPGFGSIAKREMALLQAVSRWRLKSGALATGLLPSGLYPRRGGLRALAAGLGVLAAGLRDAGERLSRGAAPL